MGSLKQNDKNRNGSLEAYGGLRQELGQLGRLAFASSTGNMFLFLGEGMYFIIFLVGDYGDPIYMSRFSAVVTMALELLVLMRYTVWEEGHLRFLYGKLKCFPIGRKKYLLSQAVPASMALGLQLLVLCAVFACRVAMGMQASAAGMATVSLYTGFSGVWCFLCFQGVQAAGERAWTLFPALLLAGMGVLNVL